MNYGNLGDIAELIAGQSPPSKSYNKSGIGLPFFQGKADYGKRNPVIKTWCSEPTKIAFPGDILISVRAPVGPVNINNVESCIGRGLSAIRVKENISRDYVYFFLKTNEERIANMGVGSTFSAITQKDLRRIKIPLPEFDEQVSIAKLLSKAESLIAQRKESIRLLDEFLKSTFLEMFGDPVKNEKGWENYHLKTIINGIESGWSPVCSKNSRTNDSEWAILKLSSVTYKKFNPDENKLLASDIKIKKKLEPNEGDILFSRKNTFSLIGATVYIFENYKRLLLPDTIFRINYKRDIIHGLYFLYLFNDPCFKKLIQSLASGASGSMPNISKEKLMKLVIPLPPFPLQFRFAEIVLRTEELIKQYNRSLKDLNILYSSLSWNAFNGGLWKM